MFQQNIVRIKAIASLLKELNTDHVFVGGATVSLYADDIAAESRPTDDVDVIIELVSYAGYAALDERLRALGFTNDIASGVICRYHVQGIVVDIMPTTPDIIGFSNKWYPEGFEQAVAIQLNEYNVKIFSLPYFIASKIEAFKNRGYKDYRFSSDFEDIVYVMENNGNASSLLLLAPVNVKAYLREEFSNFLNDSDFEEGLYAHLEPRTAPQQVVRIISIMQNVINNKELY